MTQIYLLYLLCQIGDPCQEFDLGCLDSEYPVIEHYSRSGVEGGIPQNLDIVATASPNDDLQLIINNSQKGVILLQNGIYEIDTQIKMRSGVVLRGESRDSVILLSKLRKVWEEKASTFYFDSVHYAGIENLTMRFDAGGKLPINGNPNDSNLCHSCYLNDPYGLEDLYVMFVEIERNSKNCWLQNSKADRRWY